MEFLYFSSSFSDYYLQLIRYDLTSLASELPVSTCRGDMSLAPVYPVT